MNTNELYSKIIELLPVMQSGNDFQETLQSALEKYFNEVQQLEASAFSNEKEKAETIAKIESLNKNLCKTINLYFGGRHGEAFQLFQQRMNGQDGLFEQIGVLSIKEQTEIEERNENGEIDKKEIPTLLFRAREFEDKRGHTFDEMFHIPLDQRGIVKTQRYSAPGYPCLYLGKTIYACWEEMHRPRFDDLMFSGFKVRLAFDVYDLRVPQQKDFEGEKLQKTLLRLPLIIACMVKVKNDKDSFKPEYIIPQLLIETIICNNQKKMEKEAGPRDLVWGITYTSTHVSNDFPFKFSYLENIALPVVLSDDKNKYCSVLASLFDISAPLCLEYEDLKDNQTYITWGYIQPGNEEELLREQYKVTKMRYMEDRIRYFGQYNNLPHLYFNKPHADVEIPQAGGEVKVELITDGEFEVS